MKKWVTIEVDVEVDTNDFAGEKLTAKDIARWLSISPTPRMSEELLLQFINHGDGNHALGLITGGIKRAARVVEISECD